MVVFKIYQKMFLVAVIGWINGGTVCNRIKDVDIVSGTQALGNGSSLRVCYPKGNYGPMYTGVQFPISFELIKSMPQKLFESLYIRYYVKFEQGFDFCMGGKLPGIMGGAKSWERSGGNQPDGTNGWTLRLMWRAYGRAVIYSYLPPHKYSGTDWGLDIDLNKKFKTGYWHCIEQYVKINEIGYQNGKLYVWIDNEQVLQLDDVLYRTVDNEAGKLYLCLTFHGGNRDGSAARFMGS